MKSKGPRFLFQIHNRRGLGHMMRGINIAREIRSISPASEVMFYAKSDAASALCDRDFQYFVEKDLKNYAHWPDVIRSFSPDVVIFDTVIPKGISEKVFSDSIRYVFVMRKGLESKNEAIFGHQILDRADLIIIPHSAQEFGYELPPILQKKSCFVGPIIRPINKKTQIELRERYRLRENEFLVTSTIGGGGFEQAESFFKKIFDIHRRIHSAIPNLRHIVILGPNFGKPLQSLEGMDLCVFEQELINLISISDIVIAEGGYNTVNEIRLTKTPAIFLPSSRSNDDQEERVRLLEKMGLALVFSENESFDAVGREACRIISSKTALKKMREKYQDDHLSTGNRLAAEQILKLSSTR